MITLQFVGDDDPASEAIKIFSRGWCCHVDAILPDGTLLGARLDGVKIRAPDYASFTRVERISLAASAEQETAFLAFLHAQVGKPYDRLAIAAFPFQRDWREPGSWFCSELALAALEACEFFRAPLSVPANEVTPRDLLLVVSPWNAVPVAAA